MIKIETIDVCGLKGAILGMRHPYKNTEKSDSEIYCRDILFGTDFHLGEKDHDLALRLATSAQPSDAKFLRMIHVQADICAPLYWWKEMDQYKIATTTDSESTMHTITAKKFDISDFSTDYGFDEKHEVMGSMCELLNSIRGLYLDKDAEFEPETYKSLWRSLIQLLPESYNQTRMWDANYQTLRNIYFGREGHKLSEWQTFREWIETLPYSEFITIKEI